MIFASLGGQHVHTVEPCDGVNGEGHLGVDAVLADAQAGGPCTVQGLDRRGGGVLRRWKVLDVSGEMSVAQPLLREQ